jgi:hypothetical protein
LVGDTNQKEAFFSHDVIAIMQLEGELPLRYVLPPVTKTRPFVSRVACNSNPA